VAQAQAQISALTNEQLASIQQITAATGRVQTEYIAMQLAEKQQGDANSAHWLEGFGATGFKGPNEGQGITLP